MKNKLSILVLLLAVILVPLKVWAIKENINPVPLVETVKSNNSYLSSITLSKGTIQFEKNTKNYLIGVDFTVEKITITAIPESSKAKVQIVGNETLQFGNNLYEITVTAEDNTTSIYKVTVVKLHEGETLSNNYLASLIIVGHDITFNKDTERYSIVIKDSKPLTINVALEDPNSSYQIFNNENLNDNSEVLIIVTARNGDKRIYRIQTTVENNYYLLIGLISAGGILAIILVLLIHRQISKKRKKKLLSNISKQNVISKDNSQGIYDFNLNNNVPPTPVGTANTPVQEPSKTVVVNPDVKTNQVNDNEEIL